MSIGRPKAALQISEATREKLSLIARRSKSSQAAALRARIILCCAKPMSNMEVHITQATVGKWRRRFFEKGMEGLLDEPRPGAPRKVSVHASVGVASWHTGEAAAELIARADASMYQEKSQRAKVKR